MEPADAAGQKDEPVAHPTVGFEAVSQSSVPETPAAEQQRLAEAVPSDLKKCRRWLRPAAHFPLVLCTSSKVAE